jgi:hypothetical protein
MNTDFIPRVDLKEVILGSKQIDYPLHVIEDMRKAYAGHETEPLNMELLLRARISELQWLLNEANGMVHAAERHIDYLNGMRSAQEKS